MNPGILFVHSVLALKYSASVIRYTEKTRMDSPSDTGLVAFFLCALFIIYSCTSFVCSSLNTVIPLTASACEGGHFFRGLITWSNPIMPNGHNV